MNKGLSWYAVYTRSRAEKKVYQDLTEKGIHVYLPMQKKMRQWSDRKKIVETPLFHGYVFVHINLIKSKYKVLETPNVVKFVSFSGEIATVKDKEIEIIKLILGESLPVEATMEQFSLGDTVEVMFGSMKGLEGEIIRKKRKKVLFRISSIRHNLLVEIPYDFIQKKRAVTISNPVFNEQV